MQFAKTTTTPGYGDLIRQAIHRSGRSMTWVSEQAGIHYSSLSHVCSEHKSITPDTLVRVMKTLAPWLTPEQAMDIWIHFGMLPPELQRLLVRSGGRPLVRLQNYLEDRARPAPAQ